MGGSVGKALGLCLVKAVGIGRLGMVLDGKGIVIRAEQTSSRISCDLLLGNPRDAAVEHWTCQAVLAITV
eukprot:scaffold70514_cov23-Tisochrysis_lutea.AAC.2